jgi:transcriptional regulator with XRE-family HTH domain
MSDQEYARIVSKNLRRIAYEAEKTQADISKDLKISKATISSWMNGTRVPRMDKIDLLCHYFNVKRSDIMEEKEEKEDQGESEQYYLNDDARDLAQFLFDNPEYKVLFDASRKVRREDIEFVRKMMNRMTE